MAPRLTLRRELPGAGPGPSAAAPPGLGGVERGDFWPPGDPVTGQLAAVGSPEQPGQERVFRAASVSCPVVQRTVRCQACAGIASAAAENPSAELRTSATSAAAGRPAPRSIAAAAPPRSGIRNPAHRSAPSPGAGFRLPRCGPGASARVPASIRAGATAPGRPHPTDRRSRRRGPLSRTGADAGIHRGLPIPHAVNELGWRVDSRAASSAAMPGCRRGCGAGRSRMRCPGRGLARARRTG